MVRKEMMYKSTTQPPKPPSRSQGRQLNKKGLVPPTLRCWRSPTACGAEASGTQEGWGNRCCPCWLVLHLPTVALGPLWGHSFGLLGLEPLVPQPSSLTALPNSLHKLLRF